MSRKKARAKPTHYVCRKHRGRRPTDEFPFWHVEKYRFHACRHWCADCLLKGGHISTARVREIHAAREKKQAAARGRVRVYERAVELLRACEDDPELRAAIRMATRLMEDAHAEPLPEAR